MSMNSNQFFPVHRRKRNVDYPRKVALGATLMLLCALTACSTKNAGTPANTASTGAESAIGSGRVSNAEPASTFPSDYQGKPFADARYTGGPQKIPGRVKLAYYDFGGEGVAYHDTTPQNLGSGGLNPLNGDYFNEFRHSEA